MNRKYFRFSRLLVLLLLFVGGCNPELPDEVADAYENLPKRVDFNMHVKPILSDKCFACHGPDKAKQQAGLRLDIADMAYAELPENPGKFAISVGDLKNSEVFHRILSEEPGYMMPELESNLSLSDYEKAVLIKWIEDGAEYQDHWSFVKPKPQEIPEVNQEEWVSNPIDNFVLATLETKNLAPSASADKELLLRRLSFDLTGFPPTAQEIKEFQEDTDGNAYEKQVDRLLNSAHYGERMATDWMDLSRYSDTYGYQVDRYRDMSPWRDWVINSFNENMPYDQFITWQLGGDLLPNATSDQILATGFNRLHAQNMEGGIVDEEFRVEYVADRVAVVGQGLMGLTTACARCHDHKFDPISQKNFYELYSFFNNINESGQISWDDATPTPNHLLPDSAQEKILSYLEEKEKEQVEGLNQRIEQEEEKIKAWIGTESYKKSIPNLPKRGKIAQYELENERLVNKLNPRQTGEMKQQFVKASYPNFTEAYRGKGLLLDGDAWLDLDPVGIFKRNDAFSIGIWVYLPKELEEGVIFHKNQGSRLHNFRGYHLYMKDNRLELMMARTWPDNAIIERSISEVPKDTWTHLMMTYDGSSKAAGLKVFMNGKELKTEVEIDNLYKDIIFRQLRDQIYKGPIEPGLQVGARWRGKGIGGAKVDEVIVYKRAISAFEVLQIASSKEAAAIRAISSDKLSSNQKELLRGYYLANLSKPYQNSLAILMKTRAVYVDSMESVQEVMVMKEMDKPRKSYILERGQYDAYGEEVFPNTPERILAMPEDLPKNRLGLAQWITHPEHPLTARVAVNRYWQNYFGRGIVNTTEDFGNQGELPSHPELLDWLALEFIQSGWNVKALQKLIVMSSTYRQDSHVSEELKNIDGENMWLARGPSMRLTSEMLRDNALVASGLLNDKIGGESVRSYQPAGLWKMNNGTYVEDTGDKLYRRSLYTLWKRTVPNPTLSTFDQPERNECIVRRQKTNTPLQALVLMNDPTYLEAAKVIGETMTRMADPDKSITMAYTQLTGRTPQAKELKILKELQAREYEVFKSDTEKTKGWLEAGEYEIDLSLDTNLVAANAVVASVIINSDVSITKR